MAVGATGGGGGGGAEVQLGGGHRSSTPAGVLVRH